jgi:hypothetical protein
MKNRFILFVLAIALIGCSSLQPSVNQRFLGDTIEESSTVLAWELKYLFHVETVVPPRDATYISPSLEWLQSLPGKSGDCDNVAFENFLLVDQRARNSGSYGIAFGVGYVAEPGNLNPTHALNVVRCSDRRWYLFDPNKGLVTSMNRFIAEGRRLTLVIL